MTPSRGPESFLLVAFYTLCQPWVKVRTDSKRGSLPGTMPPQGGRYRLKETSSQLPLPQRCLWGHDACWHWHHPSGLERRSKAQLAVHLKATLTKFSSRLSDAHMQRHKECCRWDAFACKEIFKPKGLKVTVVQLREDGKKNMNNNESLKQKMKKTSTALLLWPKTFCPIKSNRGGGDSMNPTSDSLIAPRSYGYQSWPAMNAF